MSEDTIIRVRCPNLLCRCVLAVSEQARGRIARCPACRAAVRIPRSERPDNETKAA